ncbi:MAG: rhodanese-like domain-containing protein [Campylobacterota bacterium]
MVKNLLKAGLVASLVAATSLSASGFGEFYEKFGDLEVNQGYGETNGKIKSRIKETGYYATVGEVQAALQGQNLDGKPIVVVDSRTKSEQEGLTLDGAVLVPLRGWNKAFEDERRHSDKIGAVYSFCRTGTDQADNIVKLQWMFQGNAKVFGLRDMVNACYPAVSKSGQVLDAALNAKKVYVQQANDGNYYEVNCPQVENACSPIAVYTQNDIDTAELMGQELPNKITMKNKSLGEDVTVYKGADNHYYKKECWENVISQ